MAAQIAEPQDRLNRLMKFLERDPFNRRLLFDAASAAYEMDQVDVAENLLDRTEPLGRRDPDQVNLKALVLLKQRRFADAESLLLSLLAEGNVPQLRFNIAWARAMQEKYEAALEMLDGEVMRVSPRAPALRVQMLHHLQRYDDALAIGHELVRRFPADAALKGALAVLAMDAGDIETAREFAHAAATDPDSMAVLGMLRLDDGDVAVAAAQFDAALAARPHNPRAMIGKGLALLAAGEPARAAPMLKRGAETFEDHLGSWIAAGWAYYIAGDLARSRECFERALAVDSNFSEAHGGLAVLEFLAGDESSARRRSDIALRLDRASLGGVLAHTMLMERHGDEVGATRVRDRVMRAPIGPGSTTLIDAIGRFASRRRQ